MYPRAGCFAMDSAATVNKMVADELERRWKAIQKRTTRQVKWPAPTEKEIIGGAHIDLLVTVPYLKEIKDRDALQPPSHWSPGICRTWWRSIRSEIQRRPPSPPDLTSLPSAPLERTIRLYDFEQWVARQHDFSGVGMLELTSALNRYTTLHCLITRGTLNDCQWRSLPWSSCGSASTRRPLSGSPISRTTLPRSQVMF
jgi:hypothetical protein